MVSRRLGFIVLSILTPLLIVLLIGTAMAEERAPDMLTLTVTPVSAEPVPAGQPAVFKVVLDNAGGQNQADMFMEINWETDRVQRAKVELVEGETTKINTQGVRRTEGKVRWQGGILKDGRLTMLVTLLPAVCFDDPFFFTVPAEAGKQEGGETINAEGRLEAACAENPFTAEDITWISSIDRLSPLAVYSPEANLLKGEAARLRLELTNESDQPLNALVEDFLLPGVGQEKSCKAAYSELTVRTAGAPTQRFDRGYLPPYLNSAEMDDNALVGFMILELQPGEKWTADLQLPLRGRVPGCEFSGVAKVYPAPADPIPGSCDGGNPDCNYIGWTTQAKNLQRLFTVLAAYDSNSISARLADSDLGDAPASENNFDHQEMNAYNGIVANFPTVYNFNIGMPPYAMDLEGSTADHREAPLHFQSHPLRLGNLASSERDADVPPRPNIIPLDDRANLDMRDDGWPAGELPGSCTPFTQKLRITVEEWAVDHLAKNGGEAYLNVFVDANGDGDWGDTTSCGGETVAEHIFINLPILITDLGVGQHEIELPANKGIKWQTDQTWLRVTLSDVPAPLPLQSGDLAYGDGRGPAAGYLLGETEDYRFRVAETGETMTGFGADLGLRLETDLQFMANHRAGSLVDTYGIRATNCLTCIEDCYGGNSFISVINLGDSIAFKSSLLVLPDPALGSNDVQISVKGDLPWLDEIAADVACSASDPDCRIEIELGDVPPRASGSLVVYASASCRDGSQACKKTNYLVKARVDAENDENSSNNQAQEMTVLPVPPEWLEPPSISYPIPGTTVGSELHIRGKGVPGRTVEIYFNGIMAASGEVAVDGFFDIVPDAHIPDSVIRQFELSAGYANIPGGERNPSRAMSVIVDNESGLFFDPMSLKFSYDDEGNISTFRPWDESGRVDANGWQVPLLEGGAYDISLGTSSLYCLTCTTSSVTFEMAGEVIASLSDSGGDGVFEGSFTAKADYLNKPVALHLRSEGEEQIFQGQMLAQAGLPKVIDGQTGQAVDGADFLIWQANRVIGGETIWTRPDEMNGRSLPGTTNKDGEVFLNVPPGVWRLGVILEEGADPLLTEPERLFGVFPSRNILVNRPAFGSGLNSLSVGEKVVNISRDGFNPPIVSVSTGEALTFQNVSLKMRGASNEEVGINSGFIAPGKAFELTFSKPGIYELVDPQEPQNMVLVTVGAGSQRIFLPVVLRGP